LQLTRDYTDHVLVTLIISTATLVAVSAHLYWENTGLRSRIETLSTEMQVNESFSLNSKLISVMAKLSELELE